MPEVLEARASEARQASGGAADGAMISAALRGGSCASVLESGDEGDSYESVALATALPLSSGAAAEGAPASSAAPKGLCEGTFRRDKLFRGGLVPSDLGVRNNHTSEHALCLWNVRNVTGYRIPRIPRPAETALQHNLFRKLLLLYR